MSLPPAVQRQADLANQLIAGNTEDNPAPNGEPDAPTGIPEGQPEPTAPAAAVEGEGADNPAPVVNDSENDLDNPEPYNGPETIDSLKEALGISEQRYATLKGKYNKEIKELREKLANSSSTEGEGSSKDKLEIERLTNEVTRLTTALEGTNQPVTVDDALDALGEEYGADLIAGVKAAIKSATSPLANQITQVSDQVNQVSANTSHAVKVEELDKSLRGKQYNFSQLNSDPLFEDYLKTKTQLDGTPLHKVANIAFADGKLDVITNICIQYMDSLGSKPDPQPDPQPQDLSQQQQQQLDPSQHVSIDPSAPANLDPSAQPQVINQDFIRQFYADVQRGQYKDRPEEKARIEKQIFDAMGQLANS